jgi:hypothetical protein
MSIDKTELCFVRLQAGWLADVTHSGLHMAQRADGIGSGSYSTHLEYITRCCPEKKKGITFLQISMMAANNKQYSPPLWVLSEFISGQWVVPYFYYSSVFPSASYCILSSFLNGQYAVFALTKAISFLSKEIHVVKDGEPC